MRKKAVSIIVPTRNEAENIKPLIERIHHAMTVAALQYEIIVIDDHSTDRTRSEVNIASRTYPVTLYMKKGVPGKAISLLEGFAKARYDLLCMIDADLQYPPEAIPEMVRELSERSGVDIVVADRKEYRTDWIRRTLSRLYLLVFGKLLHGLTVDVQSGLKVFRRHVLDGIELNPTPWTFDMEFLVRARLRGYQVTSVPITFTARHAGEAKISIFRTSVECAVSALKLKLNPPIFTDPLRTVQSVIKHRGKEFRPFTALPLEESAIESITPGQKQIIMGFIITTTIGLILNWHFTLVFILSILTTLYFIDLLFNFFLIYRSFTKNPEISITEQEIRSISADEWPHYTVFCPLYREWSVIPQFIQAMSQLDYPKERLQVMLLLEEDDTETIDQVARMRLPEYFDVVIVPHSLPKTKPKALNYGLLKARGEYVVVYDAEDVPDPKQLKKAVLAFQKSRSGTICVQAKLNFYNPGQNILTRLFTAEYSLWFDLVLTGLQSIKAPIPLGGTSNHFRIRDIHELQGWDAFNVTEDCDLGTRLTKKGYVTAIFDSTTLEEANSDMKNWYNQRSRWIKGYIQTYLVHMRRPAAFFNGTKEPHFFTFQFIIGGKIMSLFINPFMWLVTASYFMFRPIIGETIESLYLMPVFYLGVFSMIIGNFLYMYYYMVGCAKRNQEELIPFALFIPFYWLGMSIASWKAMYEMVKKPHYWAKTQHGLHLSGKSETVRRLPPLTLPSPALTGGHVSVPGTRPTLME